MSAALQSPRGRLEIGYKTGSEADLTVPDRLEPETAALLDGEAILAHSEPEFRALSYDGERKGVRLEAVFWQALEEAAAELGVPRNALAFSIMSIVGQDRANATSVLRSFLMAYMLAKKERPKAR